MRKLQRRVREGWSLAYAPDTRPYYRRPRWQPPGKLFDLTVIAATVLAALLTIF